MTKVKSGGLGRGLDSIFLDNSLDESQGNGVSILRLSQIEPNPDQPRKEFDTESLTQLAESIAANGLIQPIVVRASKSDGYYQIIAGERRWRACKMAGLIEVPVIVMDADDRKAAELALIENIQRADLNPIEEAMAIDELLSTYGMTQEELARSIGKSRSALTNTLRLLDLPDEVLSMIRDGQISAGHGKALLGLHDTEWIVPTAKIVLDKELSVRECESLVRTTNVKRLPRGVDPEVRPLEIDYIQALAKRMSSRLGREIRIKNSGKTKVVQISYEDNDDLDAIVRQLCGDNIFDED